MARAYAARLASIAFVFGLMRGAIQGDRAEQALWYSLGFLFVFGIVGLIVGHLAEVLIRQVVESNFRNNIEKYRQRAADNAAKQQ